MFVMIGWSIIVESNRTCLCYSSFLWGSRPCTSIKVHRLPYISALLSLLYNHGNIERKWNESGFRPPLCTYRLNWARRTSWGWWDDWDDTVLQTQDSKFEPWRSEAEHATSRSRRLPTILRKYRKREARSYIYALLLFRMTSVVLYSTTVPKAALYTSELWTVWITVYAQPRLQLSALTEIRSTSMLQALVDTNKPWGRPTCVGKNGNSMLLADIV